MGSKSSCASIGEKKESPDESESLSIAMSFSIMVNSSFAGRVEMYSATYSLMMPSAASSLDTLSKCAYLAPWSPPQLFLMPSKNSDSENDRSHAAAAATPYTYFDGGARVWVERRREAVVIGAEAVLARRAQSAFFDQRLDRLFFVVADESRECRAG